MEWILSRSDSPQIKEAGRASEEDSGKNREEEAVLGECERSAPAAPPSPQLAKGETSRGPAQRESVSPGPALSHCHGNMSSLQTAFQGWSQASASCPWTCSHTPSLTLRGAGSDSRGQARAGSSEQRDPAPSQSQIAREPAANSTHPAQMGLESNLLFRRWLLAFAVAADGGWGGFPVRPGGCPLTRAARAWLPATFTT